MHMDLKHLRYFVAVAEEAHFGRAAERLHMTQPPLSYGIQELEADLGVRLFERTTRSTTITPAGRLLLEDARRVLAAAQQIYVTAAAAAQGYCGYLRIAVADALAQPRLTELFALCRQEEPDVELRIFEMPVGQLVRALQQDDIDVGFTLFREEGKGYAVEPLWHDAVAVAMPARHQLLAHRRVPLAEALRYPLILCHPEMCQGGYAYIDAILAEAKVQPVIAEHVSGHESMLMMIGAGLGIGFAIEAQIAHFQRPDVAVRPMEAGLPPVTTQLLRSGAQPSQQLERFIDRARRVGGLARPENGGEEMN